MFCTQCGKKLTETMLFCPYCGHPIETAERENAPVREEQPGTVVTPTEEKSVPVDEFVPLEEILEKQEDIAPRVESLFAKWEQEEKDAPAHETAVQLHGHTPELRHTEEKTERPAGGKHAKANTFVPEKAVEISDDLFLDDDDDALEDPYDKRLNRPQKARDEDDDEPKGSFFTRHLRGIVSLALTLILVAIIAIWFFSAGGQRTMAHIGLAVNANAYAELGMEAYQKEAYAVAGRWYEKALEHDEDNYDFAYSAGVSYFYANDADKAEECFRRAIQIRPDDANAYLFVRSLYSSAKTIPEDVAALLRTGYQRTGNAGLKLE